MQGSEASNLQVSPWSVRGSYSARVPRSSLARVRRVLVPHIMEEEGEDQENEKDDRKEDRQQEVERRVAESQNNHIMSAWRWDGVKCALHAKLEPMSMWHLNVRMQVRENVTCEVCLSHDPSRCQSCFISCAQVGKIQEVTDQRTLSILWRLNLNHLCFGYSVCKNSSYLPFCWNHMFVGVWYQFKWL